MARPPVWTEPVLSELRRLVIYHPHISDDELAEHLKPLYPKVSAEAVRHIRWRKSIGLKRKSTKKPVPRPEGPQRRCLGCGKPFRAKAKRVCPRCTKANERIAA